jgi:hypothetical protein
VCSRQISIPLFVCISVFLCFGISVFRVFGISVFYVIRIFVEFVKFGFWNLVLLVVSWVSGFREYRGFRLRVFHGLRGLRVYPKYRGFQIFGYFVDSGFRAFSGFSWISDLGRLRGIS